MWVMWIRSVAPSPRVCFCPGFLRGMSFHGDHMVVGLSRLRDSDSFNDRTLRERMGQAGLQESCGLMVINLNTGTHRTSADHRKALQ